MNSSFCNQELSEAEQQGRRILVVMRAGSLRPTSDEIKANSIIEAYVNKYTYLEEEDEDFDLKLVRFLEGRKYGQIRSLVLRKFKRQNRKDHIELRQTEDQNSI